MSGRHKTYKVKLTETDSRQLQQLVAARKSSQSIALRAKVILKSAERQVKDAVLRHQGMGIAEGMKEKNPTCPEFRAGAVVEIKALFS